MSSEQMQIQFTELWSKVPPPSAKVWNLSRGREVLELLCGALWHLELAAGTGGGFSTVAMGKLSVGGRPPWQEWLRMRPALSVEHSENQLAIGYSFSAHFDPPLRNLLQTMLLANAALRLAGARSILLERGLVKTPPAILGDYVSILQVDGNFKIPSPHPPDKTRVFRDVLIVVAFRDSIMHGETLTGKKDERRKFRDLWIEGRLKQNRPIYSSAEIAQACRGVWLNLVSCLKHL